MPSTGWTTQHNQPINKTIGINKLGTLLSSQTTDTPGTTTTPIQGRDSLRSNFSNLPGSDSQCKSDFPDLNQQTNHPHQNSLATEKSKEPGFELFLGDWPPPVLQLFAGLPRGDLENNTPNRAYPQTGSGGDVLGPLSLEITRFPPHRAGRRPPRKSTGVADGGCILH